MIRYCIYAMIIGSFSQPAAAITFHNETDRAVIFHLYSGGSKCYESAPIAENSIFTRANPPRKCASPVFKLKAQSGKNVCRMVDLSWESAVNISFEDGAMHCGQAQAGGGH